MIVEDKSHGVGVTFYHLGLAKVVREIVYCSLRDRQAGHISGIFDSKWYKRICLPKQDEKETAISGAMQ